jgi:type IV pilus assembly protein PilF
MKNHRFPCYLLLVLFVLTACDKFARNDQLSLSQHTNEVAVTNLNLGIEYMQQGEYEKSLENLNRALAADSKYIPTYNALGLLYQLMGKNDQAEKYFQQALSINANDSNSLNNYGQFLCSTNHYEQAQELFLKAAANPLYETREIALANAGTCALHNNQPDVAETYYKQALEKNPRLPSALLKMSQLSFDNSDYPSAQAYLQRYLEVADQTPASLWLGIQIAQKLDDRDTVSSYALLLRNTYPDSRETVLLKDSGIK